MPPDESENLVGSRTRRFVDGVLAHSSLSRSVEASRTLSFAADREPMLSRIARGKFEPFLARMVARRGVPSPSLRRIPHLNLVHLSRLTRYLPDWQPEAEDTFTEAFSVPAEAPMEHAAPPRPSPVSQSPSAPSRIPARSPAVSRSVAVRPFAPPGAVAETTRFIAARDTPPVETPPSLRTAAFAASIAGAAPAAAPLAAPTAQRRSVSPVMPVMTALRRAVSRAVTVDRPVEAGARPQPPVVPVVQRVALPVELPAPSLEPFPHRVQPARSAEPPRRPLPLSQTISTARPMSAFLAAQAEPGPAEDFAAPMTAFRYAEAPELDMPLSPPATADPARLGRSPSAPNIAEIVESRRGTTRRAAAEAISPATASYPEVRRQAEPAIASPPPMAQAAAAAVEMTRSVVREPFSRPAARPAESGPSAFSDRIAQERSARPTVARLPAARPVAAQAPEPGQTTVRTPETVQASALPVARAAGLPVPGVAAASVQSTPLFREHYVSRSVQQPAEIESRGLGRVQAPAEEEQVSRSVEPKASEAAAEGSTVSAATLDPAAPELVHRAPAAPEAAAAEEAIPPPQAASSEPTATQRMPAAEPPMVRPLAVQRTPEFFLSPLGLVRRMPVSGRGGPLPLAVARFLSTDAAPGEARLVSRLPEDSGTQNFPAPNVLREESHPFGSPIPPLGGPVAGALPLSRMRPVAASVFRSPLAGRRESTPDDIPLRSRPDLLHQRAPETFFTTQAARPGIVSRTAAISPITGATTPPVMSNVGDAMGHASQPSGQAASAAGAPAAGEGQADSAGGGHGGDVGSMATEVFALLKRRLQVEAERMGRH